jgi:hypothetical protein
VTQLSAILRELLGLFVDDGSLAIAILGWVAIVAALMRLAGVSGALSGGLLFVGLAAILIENVWRAAR